MLVSVSYLKNEDVFVLFYPGPNDYFGQQSFKFDYYDLVFTINKLRDEIRYNKYKFYKEKDARGRFICDTLSAFFGYKTNDSLVKVFNDYCISKSVLDKCLSLKNGKSGKRKVELKKRKVLY